MCDFDEASGRFVGVAGDDSVGERPLGQPAGHRVVAVAGGAEVAAHREEAVGVVIVIGHHPAAREGELRQPTLRVISVAQRLEIGVVDRIEPALPVVAVDRGALDVGPRRAAALVVIGPGNGGAVRIAHADEMTPRVVVVVQYAAVGPDRALQTAVRVIAPQRVRPIGLIDPFHFDGNPPDVGGIVEVADLQLAAQRAGDLAAVDRDPHRRGLEPSLAGVPFEDEPGGLIGDFETDSCAAIAGDFEALRCRHRTGGRQRKTESLRMDAEPGWRGCGALVGTGPRGGIFIGSVRDHGVRGGGRLDLLHLPGRRPGQHILLDSWGGLLR